MLNVYTYICAYMYVSRGARKIAQSHVGITTMENGRTTTDNRRTLQIALYCGSRAEVLKQLHHTTFDYHRSLLLLQTTYRYTYVYVEKRDIHSSMLVFIQCDKYHKVQFDTFILRTKEYYVRFLRFSDYRNHRFFVQLR